VAALEAELGQLRESFLVLQEGYWAQQQELLGARIAAGAAAAAAEAAQTQMEQVRMF
jgi:hypothetical protein